MRVLMVTSKLPSGTSSVDMAPLVRQIQSLREAGAEVQLLEVTGLPKLKYLQSIPRLLNMARRVDIIHAHYAFCGWLARLRPRKPVVVSFMGDDLLGTPDDEGRVGRLGRLVVRTSRWLARRVDGVIVKSPEMARVVAPVPAHVVPNGVDMKTFQPMDPSQARRELGWSEEHRYVLFPGNPRNPRKGYRFANEAVDHARSLSDAANIELIPLWNVPPENVPLYMNACDVMLMASYIEGSPNVVKEALACNLPVVSVPVGDVAEMLEGVAGCRLCRRDPQEVGEALTEFIRETRRSAGRDALERRGLDLATVAQRVMSIYQEVLAGSSSTRVA